MLTLLALCASAQTPSAPPIVERLTPSDVARILASAGYEVVPTNANATRGKVSRDGMTVDFTLSIPGFPLDGTISFGTSGMDITGEIPIVEDPAAHEPQRFLFERGDHFYLAATPHLGRTATLVAYTGFGGEWSAKAIRLLFDNFWREGAAYASRHKGAFVSAPERDWSKVRLRDSLSLDRADMVSFVRAMDSWGFKRAGKVWTSNERLDRDYAVRGQTITLIPLPYGNEGNVPGLVLSVFLELPVGTDADAWVGAQRLRKKELSLTREGPHSVLVEEIVDVRNGLRLRDMRRKVEEFATAVAGLEGGIPLPHPAIFRGP